MTWMRFSALTARRRSAGTISTSPRAAAGGRGCPLSPVDRRLCHGRQPSDSKGSGYTHRSFRPDAVRHLSVTTAMHRPTVTQPDTRRDKKETARRAAFPQPGGRFRRWWQVLGSNQRRLSRRFYRPLLLPEVHAADQHIRHSRRRSAPWPSAMRPWASGLVHGRGGTHGRGRWERLRRPSARLYASELALQDACALSSSPSSPDSDPGRVSWAPRASVIRLFAASACPSMQCA